MKYAEADLEVTVGQGDASRTYLYHSVIMASLSGYIDAALTCGMKETMDKKLSFPEIKPDDWDQLMGYIEPSQRCFDLPSEQKAMELIHWYHKYDFHEGIKLCDFVISQYLQTKTKESSYERNQSFSNGAPPIEFCVCTFTFDLEISKENARRYIQDIFKDRRVLNIAQIEMLAPIWAEEDVLWNRLERVMGGTLPVMERSELIQERSFAPMVHNRLKFNATREGIQEAGTN